MIHKLKNGYTARFNPLFKKYIINHLENGAGIESFKTLQECREYANNDTVIKTSKIMKVGLKKDGTLKKGFKYAKGGAIKKAKGLNAPQTAGLRKVVAKSIGIAGLKKKDGTLKKGFKYKKGGAIVKIKAK